MLPLKKPDDQRNFFRFWEPIVVLVSIYILFALTVETLYQLSLSTYRLMFELELLVCAVFVADFLLGWYYSENRPKFFRREWMYLLISLPYVHLVYWFDINPTPGLLFLLQLIRLLRSAKGLTILIKHLTEKRVNTILSTYVLYLVTTLYFCSLSFYGFEKGVNPNVHTYFDAVWWSIITVTTVGYGDIAPITVPGRLIAIILILGGMGLFSTITAFLSSRFLDMHRQRNTSSGEFSPDNDRLDG